MKTIYLNNAATAWPRAPGVIEAVSDTLATPPSHPGRSVSAGTDVVRECRERLAGLLGGVPPSRIVLSTNATGALNLALLGIDLEQEASVVITVTEHNSVLRPLHHLAKKKGIRIITVGLDDTGALDEEAFEAAMASRPALVVMNHASNVTGRVNRVERFLQRAKAIGATTLLDASQTLGHRPVDAEALSADLVAFTGHKGLRGPAGTGGLYVNPALELEQVIVGGTGVRSDLMLHPPDMPMRLEAGTPNVPALAGLAAALRWLAQDGDAFCARERETARSLREGLKHIDGVRVADAASDPERVGIVSFQLRGWDVEEVGFVLSESFGVVCRTGLHCAPLIHKALGTVPAGTIRLSVSGFTTDEDIAVALDAVSSLAQ